MLWVIFWTGNQVRVLSLLWNVQDVSVTAGIASVCMYVWMGGGGGGIWIILSIERQRSIYLTTLAIVICCYYQRWLLKMTIELIILTTTRLPSNSPTKHLVTGSSLTPAVKDRKWGPPTCRITSFSTDLICLTSDPRPPLIPARVKLLAMAFSQIWLTRSK